VVNVGSGESVSVNEIAARLARILGARGLEPEVTGTYRVGDIRHCFADVTRAKALLGYEPLVAMDDGMASSPRGSRGRWRWTRSTRPPPQLRDGGLTV
jgi:dTDP-L-rhamnose 4-epimerase